MQPVKHSLTLHILNHSTLTCVIIYKTKLLILAFVLDDDYQYKIVTNNSTLCYV